jgi:glycine cleavage system H protein
MESIRLTIDKFVFQFPGDLRYSEEGLWIRQEDNLLRIGLSDFAQQRSGDIAFANLKPVGSILNIGDEVASIETVKVDVSLPCPVRGRITEVNSLLEDSPEWINQEPYGRGWMAVLQGESAHEFAQLLDAEEYRNFVEQQVRAELKS